MAMRRSVRPVVLLGAIVLLLSTRTTRAADPVCKAGTSDGSCDAEESPCLFYAGIVDDGDFTSWRAFAGVPIAKHTPIGPPSPMIVVNDANKRESTYWHNWMWSPDIAQDMIDLDVQFTADVFAPGVGSLVQCGNPLTNVHISDVGKEDAGGVHRSLHHTAGSFATRFGYTMEASIEISAGEELFVSCGEGTRAGNVNEPPHSLEFMEDNFQCMDRGLATPGPSTLVGAGRGLLATRDLTNGTVITTSPVIPIEKRDFDITDQSINSPWHERDIPELVFNASQVTGRQLLLNYCFGHANSSILFLPVGSLVHSINHDGDHPNIGIRWSQSSKTKKYFKRNPSKLMLSLEPLELSFDFVLLRDVREGEELVMDYGVEWQQAFETHGQDYDGETSYMSALEYNEKEHDVRTMQEQTQDPYPSNIRTGCFYTPSVNDIARASNQMNVTWNPRNAAKCLRPCEIQERNEDGTLTALVRDTQSHWALDICRIPVGYVVSNIPLRAIRFIDGLYTTDQHQSNAFRHWIGVPDDLYPVKWMEQPLTVATDFKKKDLAPWEVSQVRWKKKKERIVADYTYELGLDPTFTASLLEYCNRIGVTDAFRHLLVNGNPLEPDSHVYSQLGDHNWYIQRPTSDWHSNMHWISPASEVAHHEYLRALSGAGFDNALKSIGEHFGLGGLVAYHVTFIGVSHCAKGFIHFDFKKVQGKAFNVIIPLILANETGPELELVDDEENVGMYKYRYHTATMVGDFAEHATAAADYRSNGELRMAATVYLADFTPKNRKRLVKDFTQAYPSKKDAGRVFESAGRHWKPDQPNRRLPKPFVSLDKHNLNLGGIMPLKWGDRRLATNAFRLLLPQQLTSTLGAYMDKKGLTFLFEDLLIHDMPYKPGEFDDIGARGYNWYIRRPEDEASDMHLASPRDDIAFREALSVLSAGGFDQVLQQLGEFFALDGIAVYQLVVSGHSYARRPPMKANTVSTGNKIFRIDVPVFCSSGESPAVDVRADSDKYTVGQYRHSNDTALITGDGAFHATTLRDDLRDGNMQVIFSVWVGDVTKRNVDETVTTMTSAVYPPKDKNALMSMAKSHWSLTDASKRLPEYANDGDFIRSGGPIESMRWIGDMAPVHKFAYEVRVPESVTRELSLYIDQLGIKAAYEQLLIHDKSLTPAQNRTDTMMNGMKWFVQRPNSQWNSNMHWISPYDKESHTDYLKVLGRGGFDQVLGMIGRQFDLEGLTIFHLSFIGVTQCDDGFVHSDFENTGGRAFNLIIPIIIVNDSDPELEISNENGMLGSYKYRKGSAPMVGDGCEHVTASVDYHGEMRVGASIYLADIQPDNVANIVKDYTQHYPPKGDAQLLLDMAGIHWKRDSSDVRLPT